MIPAVTVPLIDVMRVRRQLAGVLPTLNMLDPSIVDGLIRDGIAEAESEFSADTNVWLRQRKCLSMPTSSQVLGTDYDVKVDQLDYHTSSFSQSAYFQLPHRPVQSIQRASVEYGTQGHVFDYPLTWLRVDSKMGRVSIVPTAQLGAGYGLAAASAVSYLPLLRGGYLQGVVPIMVSFDYTAGIPDIPTNPDWEWIRATLARMAALSARAAALELFPTSAGRDGVSTSYASAASQIQLMQDKIDEAKARMRATNAPFPMVVV